MKILKNSLIETAEGKPFYNVQLCHLETSELYAVRTLYWHPHRKDWVLVPTSLAAAQTLEEAAAQYLDAQIVCEGQAEHGDEVEPPRTMHCVGDEYEYRDLVAG